MIRIETLIFLLKGLFADYFPVNLHATITVLGTFPHEFPKGDFPSDNFASGNFPKVRLGPQAALGAKRRG